jgi:hypothetical protein
MHFIYALILENMLTWTSCHLVFSPFFCNLYTVCLIFVNVCVISLFQKYIMFSNQRWKRYVMKLYFSSYSDNLLSVYLIDKCLIILLILKQQCVCNLCKLTSFLGHRGLCWKSDFRYKYLICPKLAQNVYFCISDWCKLIYFFTNAGNFNQLSLMLH